MKVGRYAVWCASLVAIGALGAVFLFRSVRVSVASEGYDTDEAAWNYLIRRGEIRFRLLDGSKITAISSMDKPGVIDEPNEAYVRLGYGKFFTDLEYLDANGESLSLKMHTAKFNNWNRVLYVQDDSGGFTRYDNGVVQEPDTVHIMQGEQDGAGQPATAPKSSDPFSSKPKPESEVRPQ